MVCQNRFQTASAQEIAAKRRKREQPSCRNAVTENSPDIRMSGLFCLAERTYRLDRYRSAPFVPKGLIADVYSNSFFFDCKKFRINAYWSPSFPNVPAMIAYTSSTLSLLIASLSQGILLAFKYSTIISFTFSTSFDFVRFFFKSISGP